MRQSSLLKFGFAAFMAAGLTLAAGCTEESQLLVPLPPDNREKIDDEVDAVQIVGPKVDILFIIDNSGSMDPHQQNLANNIDLFVHEITSNGTLIDYRIGVTTTDDDQNGGTLRRTSTGANFVDKFTPNAQTELRSLLLVGISPYAAIEQMFNPIWRAFNPPLSTGNNAGFLRQDAFLAVVFITDAEEQSTYSAPRMTAPQIIQFLDGLKGRGKWLTYGAILPVGYVPCYRGESEPKILQKFLEDTNPTPAQSNFFSLCDPDFGKNLAGLGSNLVSKVGRTILLSRFPIVDTIKVTYGTQVIENDYKKGWYYIPATNAIAFGTELELTQQPPGTQFKVSFVSKKN